MKVFRCALRTAGCALVALLATSERAGAQTGSAAPPAAQASSRGIQARLGVTVQPETVSVGDPFLVLVRVQAPLGSTIEFPEGPDSAAKVEALDARGMRPNADSSAIDITAAYRLAAWDVGDQPLQLGDIVVKLGGDERRLTLGRYQVVVRTVLPEDSAQRVPKPPRPPFEFPRPWWHYLLAALAVLGIIGLLIWLWMRRKRPKPEIDVDPYKLAEEEFARVESLGLVEAGERGRFVALMVEVLRHYLAARVDGAWTSLTSNELAAVVRKTRNVPADRLAAILAESDLIKFARRPVTAEGARTVAREARAIVKEVDDAIRREEEARAAKAAAAAAEKKPQERQAA
jgi:hypothetical protein